MGEYIDIDPAALSRLAKRHGEAAGYLRAVPANHPEIQASVDSLGPIFAEFSDAARDLLEQRRRCYQVQADEHELLAEHLGATAALWRDHEQTATGLIRNVLDET